jgi:hypothetical protein
MYHQKAAKLEVEPLVYTCPNLEASVLYITLVGLSLQLLSAANAIILT